MNFEYSLSKEDYLKHQLYTASKKESLIKQRSKSKIFVTLFFFILGVFLFLNTKIRFLSYYFLGVSIINLIFYPNYQKQKYQKHYEKYIGETYKNRFNEISKVNFNENVIDIEDFTGETKIKYNALEEINEIENHIFLKLKSGGDLIIPKLKIENLSDLKIQIKNITEKYNLNHNIELEWKWK